MLKRLRNRLLFLNMSILAIVIVLAFSVIYFITYTNIEKENQIKLESIPKVSRTALGNTHLPRSHANNSNKESEMIRAPINYSPSFSVLVDSNGRLIDMLSYIEIPDELYDQIATEIWSIDKKDGSLTLDNRKWQYHISSPKNKRVLREITGNQFNEDNEYYYIAFLDITDTSKTLTQLLITFIFVGIGVLLILFGVSYHFATSSIRPIEDNWKKQQQFVADASHELKTPLAIIRANTDALLANHNETVFSQKKWIDYIQSETGRMGRLLNDMLYLAKVENTYENQLPFDISGTVLDIIASMEAVLFEKGIKLKQTIEPEIIVKGDEEKIKQAILILLDNAAKYTNKDGAVDITLRKTKNLAEFAVQNTSEAIAIDKLSRIFDRFYRSDPSRSKETEGYGLGLPIAKTIIERSGGEIYATNTDGKTTVIFELKIK